MIASTPSQPEMVKLGRVDNQKSVVISEQEKNIPDADATIDDQPIPDVGDQSETNDYEGFLELGFMAQTDVPLSVVYPD